MKLIVGLGNPEKKYTFTRHNLGWLVLDKLANGLDWSNSSNAAAQYIQTTIADQPVELLKPFTYMNNSGLAVAYAAQKHDLRPKDIIIIYDDMALPWGKLRIGQFNSSGGHNGIKSIIDKLGYRDFIRLRLGIYNDQTELMPREKFVLQKFGPLEKKHLPQILNQAEQVIHRLLKTDLATTQSEFN
ncbi:MAG: aminoacyl-tRNA hydrolase [Candidatus Komeilibacteria bacterium]